jgi:hypothetical protein
MFSRILGAVLTLAALALSPAYADEATRLAKADQVMRAAKTDELLRQSLDISMKQAREGMLRVYGASIPPERQKDIDALQDKLHALFMRTLTWEKLKPSFVKLYADAFTDEELDGLLAFHESPAGQAMITKLPGLMIKANQAVQQATADVMPEIRKLIMDAAEKSKDAHRP